MNALLRSLFSPWTWRMAWRDTRTSRGRLLLFAVSIVLGVAGLAANGSLGKNLEEAVAAQSKTLLGADLSLSSRRPFTNGEETLFDSLGGEQSRETAFSTMLYFPKGGGTRLVSARALGGSFPWYGRLETDPPEAVTEFRQGRGAIVEQDLLYQFGAKVGDTIRLGKLTLPIVGALRKVPGEAAALATVSPRVYFPMADLSATGLLGGASLAQYKIYFKFPETTNVEQLVTNITPQLDRFRLDSDTVAKRQRNLGNAMDNFYNFLNLAGLAVLILGGVGVAGGIHGHVKQKLRTVAILRCLGGCVAPVFSIYLAQGIVLGLVGAALGAGIGLVVPLALPGLLGDFMPVNVTFQPAWLAVARAAGIGFTVCLLFCILPLLAVRRVSPWVALRVTFETASSPDPLRRVIFALLAAIVLGFAFFGSHNHRAALGFVGGIAAAFLLLAATARALTALARKLTRPNLPFVLRQGLSNLHRPDNRTQLLLLSLGLGAFLLVGIYLVQHTLMSDLIIPGAGNANAVLFDIQSDQKESVAKLIRSLGLPVLDELPIVTMRISSINGRSVESLLVGHETNTAPSWPLRREYRSTYSDHLRDAEKVIAGQWIPQANVNNNSPVPISVEEGIAKELHVNLGDEIVFDVQGVPVKTVIASLREVDWRRTEPNFFMLFPRGVLEDAPSMNVLVTRVDSSAQSALMQRSVVNAFPNVSVIDLTLILQTVDAIIAKVSLVIRFMALFTVLTGVLVMVGALVSGHFQRVQECVLLRTLGASGGQIFRILTVEYLSLGLLAALVGILLALAAAWALAAFAFEVPFAPPIWPLLAALVAVPALTLTTGLLMSRGILNQPPLAVLRAEN
jgi:putative ABC transport system permease protein